MCCPGGAVHAPRERSFVCEEFVAMIGRPASTTQVSSSLYVIRIESFKIGLPGVAGMNDHPIAKFQAAA